MPATPHTPTPTAPARHSGAARTAVLCLVVALVLAVVLLAGRQPLSHAADEEKVDIAYLYVTGEGSTAKAWYDGAPSPGVPVQDALNKFAKEGYLVSELRPDLRGTQEADSALVILLQRVR